MNLLKAPEHNSFLKNGTIGYAVMNVPGRKRIALVHIDGAVYTPVAYFRNKGDANRFVDFLYDLGRIGYVPPETTASDARG